MKLKEGMYVRTETGIGKIINFDGNLINIDLGYRKTIDYKPHLLNIIKSSNNIIDLIEEGDFVKVRIDGIFINCFMVDLFEDENENQELGIGCYEDGLLNSISEYRPLNTLEILKVLTKEQFESSSYKVEE